MGNTNNKKYSDNDVIAADGARGMVTTFGGLNLNASNNYKKITITYPESSEELNILPLELWYEILLLVEDQTLSITVPRVSRLLYHFTGEDSDIWRRKCEVKYKNEEKPQHLSWKKFYNTSVTKLFPLWGMIIGKTTHQQLCAAQGSDARVSGSSRYVEYKEVNFWVHSENNLFTSMYICRGIYIIPPEWEAKGLTWEKSFQEYKEWCKKTFGNYKVTDRPHESEFQGQMCFTASLETIVREAPDVLYLIKFDFSFTQGSETTPETLYSVSLTSYNDLNQDKSEFDQRFDERQGDDG